MDSFKLPKGDAILEWLRALGLKSCLFQPSSSLILSWCFLSLCLGFLFYKTGVNHIFLHIRISEIKCLAWHLPPSKYFKNGITLLVLLLVLALCPDSLSHLIPFL